MLPKIIRTGNFPPPEEGGTETEEEGETNREGKEERKEWGERERRKMREDTWPEGSKQLWNERKFLGVVEAICSINHLQQGCGRRG